MNNTAHAPALETFAWFSNLIVAEPLSAPIVVETLTNGVELVLDYKITDYTTSAVSFAYGATNAQIIGNALAVIAEESGKQYFYISSDDGEINWTPRFETRREAQNYLEEDHDWDCHVSVEFEGRSVVSLCPSCGVYALLDDMAGTHRLTAIYLCINCQ